MSYKIPTQKDFQSINFDKDIAYIDIQSNGRRQELLDNFMITTITLFDGSNYKHYVNGINLAQFKDDIKAFKAVVTWWGSGFDLPEISRNIQLSVDWTNYIHFDLCLIFRHQKAIKYPNSSLKYVKTQRKIETTAIRQLNGKVSLFLWEQYIKGDKTALKLLLTYNTDDVIPLKYLFRFIYTFFVKKRIQDISLICQEDLIVDYMILVKLKQQYFQLINKCMGQLEISEEISQYYVKKIEQKDSKIEEEQ